MVWGGLVLTLERDPYRVRLGIAGVVVALVAFSRLVFGVHYLVGVIVGIVLGLLVLGVLYRLSDGGSEPERVLLFAVAVGRVGLFVDVTFDSAAAFGGAVGGWLVWRGVTEMTPANPSNGREVATGFVVFAVASGLFGIIYVVTPFSLLAFLGAAISVGGAVGAPVLGDRLV